MAATSTKKQTVLLLKVKTGVDENGKDIIKNVSIKNVKVTATAQDIYDTSKGLETLFSFPLDEILSDDQNVIINQ